MHPSHTAGFCFLSPEPDRVAGTGDHKPPPSPAAPVQRSSKIRTFDQALMGGRHLDNWKRQPNLTGAGATHVRSFHCKLTGESLDYLDRQINEWLDEHPEYEVKFVNTTVGEWTGKSKEPNLIVQIWV